MPPLLWLQKGAQKPQSHESQKPLRAKPNTPLATYPSTSPKLLQPRPLVPPATPCSPTQRSFFLARSPTPVLCAPMNFRIPAMDIRLLVNPEDSHHQWPLRAPCIRRGSPEELSSGLFSANKRNVSDPWASTPNPLPRRSSANVSILRRNTRTDSDSEASALDLSRRSTVTSVTSASSEDAEYRDHPVDKNEPGPQSMSPVPKLTRASPFPVCYPPASTSESPTAAAPPTVPPANYEAFLSMANSNRRYPLHLDHVSFTDTAVCGDHNSIVRALHQRYVEPLLAITGYKWVRKDASGKTRTGTHTLKYVCSQQKMHRSRPGGRQLSHPLKEFDCDSYFCIKFHPASSMVSLSYHHHHHLPYRYLPEKVKRYISDQLDRNVRAQEVYEEILQQPQFSDVHHLLHLTKVQSYWTKEKAKRRQESTKQAFRQFLDT